jgi:hypothetical protein
VSKSNEKIKICTNDEKLIDAFSYKLNNSTSSTSFVELLMDTSGIMCSKEMDLNELFKKYVSVQKIAPDIFKKTFGFVYGTVLLDKIKRKLARTIVDLIYSILENEFSIKKKGCYHLNDINEDFNSVKGPAKRLSNEFLNIENNQLQEFIKLMFNGTDKTYAANCSKTTNIQYLETFINDKLKIPVDIQQDVIDNLDKDKFNDLITLKNDNLETISEKLKITKFTLTNNDLIYNTYKSLKKTIDDYNKLYKLYEPYSTNKNTDLIKIQTQNQIERIKDARIGATKMVLMHVVTGQVFKHTMVEETIKLTETLYKATEIDFNTSNKVDGTIKYTKILNNTILDQNKFMLGGNYYNRGNTNRYKINYDFIEIID